MAEELVMNIKSNIKGVTKDTDKLGQSMGKISQETKKASGETTKLTQEQKNQNVATQEGIGNFRLMGVSLNGLKASFVAAAASAKAMFISIKAGLIATGIGAFVVLIASLVSYFKNTQRGAEMLERAMAGLGAVVDVVTDLFSSVGETIVNTFTNPKKAITDLWEFIKDNLMNRLTGVVDGFMAAGKGIEAALSFDWDTVKEAAAEYGQALIQVGTGMDVEQQKAFADGIKEIGKEMNNEADAAMRLKGIMQNVRREEMEFSKVQAQTRQDVAKARLKAMDESLSQEERLKAINSVMEKEMDMTAGLIELQKKKVAAKIEENELGESMIEDKEALAALEVELIDLTTASTMTQKRLMLEVETLTNEMTAKKKADAKAFADAEKKRIKSEKLDTEAFSLWKLERLQGETDEALKIRMKAAAELQKTRESEGTLLLALQQENSLALIENLQERALAELKIQEDKDIAKASLMENSEEMLASIQEKYARKRNDIDKKFSKDQVKWSEMTADQQMSIAHSTAGSLSKILGEETAAGKAMAITQATIDTYKGATSAYASMSGIPVVGPALGAVAAAAAIAAGLANVKAITSASSSSSSPPPPPGAPPPAPPAPQMMSGAFELGGGLEPDPVKAFVVTDEMSSSQNQLANIRRQATI
tara:strand:+ start:2651 stop:4603 length:1953 start_codon:yes stop_codon:yes gene_type:complete